MSASIPMTASVSIDAGTPVTGRLFPPIEGRGPSALLTIGRIAQVLSVHIDSKEQLAELVAVLTEVHREWSALESDPDDVSPDELEAGGELPPW